jgi:hypothetical protein
MTIVPPEKAPASELDLAEDRRRPGRRDVKPELIPLLRRTAPVEVSRLEDSDELDLLASETSLTDPLSSARGIKLAVMGGAIAWSVIIGALFWIRF